METVVYKITDPVKDIEILKKAADCVDSGGLVVFPTETVYGIACKADKKSLQRLDEVKKRDAEKRYTLHIGDKNKLQDFVPAGTTLTGPAKKLVKNAWPGPLTIVFEIQREELGKLPPETIEILYKDNTIGIRCPGNNIAREFLNLCKYPVVAPSANTAGKEPATNAQDAIEQLDGLVDMVLDGGACKYKKSSSVVKISPTGWPATSGVEWEVLREGVFSKRQIQKMLTINILFVCTGNTCRSPMAEGFAKKALAEKLGCKVDQLGQMGYKVSSAGISAMNGIGATDYAIKVCDSRNIDISNHKSRNITAEMIKDADYIFAMSEGQKSDIIQLSPDGRQKCMLLDENKNINDPIGGDFETYKMCGQIIEKAVIKRISEL
ncbi:MAG: L-threonylcarbamoyladenylate synthase [Sedimentisphaerales bacterium]